MVRKLLASTAIAGILATGAFAQTTQTAPVTATEPAMGTMGTQTPAEGAATGAAPAETGGMTAAGAQIDYLERLGASQHLETDLDGATVYATNAPDAETAGEIQNFVVAEDGTVLAVVIDTGSYLGDEAKTVAVPFDRFEWGMEGTEQRPVLTASREELMSAPAFTGGEDMAAANTATTPAGGAMAPAAGGTAMAPDAGTAAPMTGGMAPATGMAAGTTAPATTGTDTATMAAGATGQSENGYLATLAMNQHLSNDIVGDNVYSGPGDDAEQIGSINDLVIDGEGRVAAFVVGVGGFLGIGQKNVGVPFDNIAMTTQAEGEPRASLAATRDDLTNAPSFEARDNQMAASTTGPAGTTTAAGTAAGGMAAGGMAATAPGTTTGAGTMATTGAGTMATDPTEATASTTGAQTMDPGTPVTGADLTADNLMGTRVHGPDDSTIGSVGDIALTPEGEVDAVIVDVGGFLGIGAKPVAVSMDNLNIMRDSGGSLTITTQFTQDQLRAAPEYDRDTYAENRDTMRITSPADVPAQGAATNQ